MNERSAQSTDRATEESAKGRATSSTSPTARARPQDAIIPLLRAIEASPHASASRPLAVHRLLDLQRARGNQYVQRLVKQAGFRAVVGGAAGRPAGRGSSGTAGLDLLSATPAASLIGQSAAADNGARAISATSSGWTVQRYGTPEHVKFGGEQGKQRTIGVNGVKMLYGEAIAMGDFFAGPGDMFKASEKKLRGLLKLIRRSAKSPVKNERWDAATDGEYTKLASRNSSHFAPPNRQLIAPGKNSGDDHFKTWGRWHYTALEIAAKDRAGKHRDKALAVNAFADHFLTDAFAAGHLFNKDEAMAQFTAGLEGSGFFGKVARQAWSEEKVAKLVSQYEMRDRYWKVAWTHRPNINNAGRFQAVLEGIHKEEPHLMLSAVVLPIHDLLNALAKDDDKGVEVENRAGDTWNLSGDGTLNKDSLTIGRRAVAQSQQNVLDVLAMKRMPKVKQLDAMARAVWDYAPAPTPSGLKTIRQHLALCVPSNPLIVRAVATLISDNIEMIMKELEGRKKLKKA